MYCFLFLEAPAVDDDNVLDLVFLAAQFLVGGREPSHTGIREARHHRLLGKQQDVVVDHDRIRTGTTTRTGQAGKRRWCAPSDTRAGHLDPDILRERFDRFDKTAGRVEAQSAQVAENNRTAVDDRSILIRAIGLHGVGGEDGFDVALDERAPRIARLFIGTDRVADLAHQDFVVTLFEADHPFAHFGHAEAVERLRSLHGCDPEQFLAEDGIRDLEEMLVLDDMRLDQTIVAHRVLGDHILVFADGTGGSSGGTGNPGRSAGRRLGGNRRLGRLLGPDGIREDARQSDGGDSQGRGHGKFTSRGE